MTARRIWIRIVSLTAVLAVCAVMLHLSYNRFLKSAYPMKYAEQVTACAEQYGFEPSLIFALIRTESGFDPDIKSRANAIGLMQITEDTFMWAQQRMQEKRDMTTEDLYDPDINIEYGVIILSLLRKRYDNTLTALAAYNAGMTNVGGWLENPLHSDDGVTLASIPFPETEKYVEKIPAAQEIYKSIYKID